MKWIGLIVLFGLIFSVSKAGAQEQENPQVKAEVDCFAKAEEQGAGFWVMCSIKKIEWGAFEELAVVTPQGKGASIWHKGYESMELALPRQIAFYDSEKAAVQGAADAVILWGKKGETTKYKTLLEKLVTMLGELAGPLTTDKYNQLLDEKKRLCQVAKKNQFDVLVTKCLLSDETFKDREPPSVPRESKMSITAKDVFKDIMPSQSLEYALFSHSKIQNKWMRCAVGQLWDGKKCTGKAKIVRRSALETVCPTGFRLASSTDWKELLGGCQEQKTFGGFEYVKCQTCLINQRGKEKVSPWCGNVVKTTDDRDCFWVSDSHVQKSKVSRQTFIGVCSNGEIGLMAKSSNLKMQAVCVKDE